MGDDIDLDCDCDLGDVCFRDDDCDCNCCCCCYDSNSADNSCLDRNVCCLICISWDNNRNSYHRERHNHDPCCWWWCCCADDDDDRKMKESRRKESDAKKVESALDPHEIPKPQTMASPIAQRIMPLHNEKYFMYRDRKNWYPY